MLNTSAEQFFAGSRPMFAIEQGYRWNGYAVALRNVSRAAPDVCLAAVVNLDTTSASNAEKRLDQRADIRIADPRLWRVTQSGSPVATDPANATKQSIYQQAVRHSDSPTGNTAGRWIRAVLDAQRQAGANVVLTATSWVGGGSAVSALSEAMGWVGETRRQLDDDPTPLFVNLAMDGQWLRDKNMLDALLNELVESDEPNWYLRFYWPQMPVRYGQLTDAAILEGYRLLSEVAVSEQKRLVLANTSLTGWITCTLGAAGFSTGASWPAQAFAPASRGGGRKGVPPPPAKPRYFERSLLHTVEATNNQRLRTRPDYADCTCAYCPRARRLLNWDRESAGGHYLVSTATLLQETAVASNAKRVARTVVARASAFSDALTGVSALGGDDRPRHLSLWRTILS